MAYDPEAVYNTTVADIELQAGQEEGALTESEATLKANTGYQESEITRAEPGVYRAESNTANRGGLLTSGINSRRKEGIASNFAARRTQNALTLTEGEARIKREREGGKLKRTRETHGAEETRAHEKDRIGKETASAVAPELSPVPTVAGTTPQPVTGGAKPRVKGKYVKGGKVVPATTPGAIYQAWE